MWMRGAGTVTVQWKACAALCSDVQMGGLRLPHRVIVWASVRQLQSAASRETAKSAAYVGVIHARMCDAAGGPRRRRPLRAVQLGSWHHAAQR